MKDKLKIISLNEHSTEHRYMQVYRQMKETILSGTFPHNQRLPSVRKLAADLRVNTVTIVKAYDLLQEEGLVRKESGSGTYVDYGRPLMLEDTLMEDDVQRSVFISPDTINFASATPSPDLFPVREFKTALLEVLDRDQGYAFSYQDPKGYEPLRKAVGKMAENVGIKCESDNVHIISGAQQGIDLVAKGLLYPGETVVIERPSYGGAMQAFFSRNARVVDVPLDIDGISLDHLSTAIRETRPRLLYIMPNFQNPTGISYTHEKKKKLIELSEKYDFLILEDDYLNELSFGQQPAEPIKVMDRCDRVIYIKSFSKMFMPGLRLGYLIVPQRVAGKLLTAKQSSDISTSGLLQRALERYLSSGAWEHNLHRLYTEYQQRFHRMAWMLDRSMPQSVAYHKPTGGLNFWLKLPDKLNGQLLYKSAMDRKLVFAPGNLFFLGKSEEKFIRLSIAAVKFLQIEEGIKLLAQLIRMRMQLDHQESPVVGQFRDPTL